jgi:hypothetical protein
MKCFILLVIFTLSACAYHDSQYQKEEPAKQLPREMYKAPHVEPSTHRAPQRRALIYENDCDELIALKLASGWMGQRPDQYEWLDHWAPGAKEKQIEMLRRLEEHPEEVDQLGAFWKLAVEALRRLRSKEK